MKANRYLLVLLTTFLWPAVVLGVVDDLADLKSSMVAVRQAAFYRLIGANDEALRADPLRSALIELLKIETAREQSGAAGGDPDDVDVGDYVADVISVVVRLNDPRTVETLANWMSTGNMVIDALVSMGPTAVAPVASHVANPSPYQRGSAVLTLTKMVSPNNFPRFDNAEALSAIQTALKIAESDKDPYVASFAETGLGTLASPTHVAGDVDGNGLVECADLSVVKSLLGEHTRKPGFVPAADVNMDGNIDGRDMKFVATRVPAALACR